MNDERNRAYFKETFSEITAPSALVGKVLDMTENENRTVKRTINKKVVLLIAAAILVLLATGAAWVVSSLSVDINNYRANEGSCVIEIPEASGVEGLIQQIRESDSEMFSEEYIEEIQRSHSVQMYSITRLKEVAEKYGVEYKERAMYEYKKFDEYFCEVGMFFNDADVFFFCHTDNEGLESQTVIKIILFNPETGESKWEKIIFKETGAHIAKISAEEGWMIESVMTYFYSTEMGCGGGSSEAFKSSGEGMPSLDWEGNRTVNTYIDYDTYRRYELEMAQDEELDEITAYWESIWWGTESTPGTLN